MASVFNRSKKKGFTLIEVLLVLFLLGILGVAALSMYTNSTKTFDFLSQYKSVVSIVRSARAYAVTSKSINGVAPERYGARITENEVFVFADDGNTEFVFDDGAVGADTKILGKSHSLKNTKYSIAIENNAYTLPINLFYDISTGNITICDSKNETVDKSLYKHLSFSVSDGSDLKKYFTIYQVSGVLEEKDKL